ncbi:C-type lectin domain family 4 member G-like protein [Dinothrombium tinctorium]|uniref:C-type lectin domain family 4 member G-like protein n=1 Tax=Dinothrombium tinctorium TaxID=1965070 RepID=A0A3S3Q9P0_9ACAR|nr:C-type lectin domain family 4 member G-like protein [Dinothrombium tinctorium]
MVTIHSLDELNYLVSKSESNMNDCFWLGGVQAKKKTPLYKWLDGSKFSFSKWRKNEPDHTLYDLDCIGIALCDYFGDAPCDRTFKKLCQKLYYENLSQANNSNQFEEEIIKLHDLVLKLNETTRVNKKISRIESHIQLQFLIKIEVKMFIVILEKLRRLIRKF